MSKTQIRILVAIAMIASAACSKKKEEVVPVPVPGPSAGYSSLEDFKEDVKLIPQVFQLGNAAGGVITGDEGTQLTFPANAFLHQNGTAVTGNVTITLLEANKKSEMVLGGIFTATATVPLISGGQFKFVASQDGEQLKFAPGKKAAIVIPSANPDNNMVAYIQAGSSGDFYYVVPNDSSSTIYLNGTQYNGFTDSMKWVNCDHPFVQANYKTLQLTTGAGFTSANTEVLLVFKNINTVTRVPNSTNSSAFVYSFAPAGYDATIVAMGVKNGKLYGELIPFSITADQAINLTLNETNAEDFTAQIEALN